MADETAREAGREAGREANGQARETLVFIHGSGDSAAVWEPVIAGMEGYPTLALDLPGHGALVERPGPAEMSVDDYTDAVRAELARRGLARVTLAGHSLGGAVALRLALGWPSVVRRLALIGTGARLRVVPAFLEQARHAGERGVEAITQMSFAQGHEAQATAYHAGRAPTAPGILYRDLSACDHFDAMADLGRVAQPTLIIVGAHDRMTPPKYAEYLRERIAGSQLVTVPDAGHYVQLERPDVVAKALRDWLARAE